MVVSLVLCIFAPKYTLFNMRKALLSLIFMFVLSVVGVMPVQAQPSEDTIQTVTDTLVNVTQKDADVQLPTVEDLQQQLQYLQSRSHMSLLSSLMLVALIVMFFVWNIKKRNQRHLINLERKNIALQREHDLAVKARNEAEAASQMKTRFIQQMSHEIRTPLNAINGFTQILGMDDSGLDKSEIEHMRQSVMDNTNHLTNMLNDILLLADTESRMLTNDKVSTINLTDLAAHLMEVTFLDAKEGDKITTDINMLVIALQNVVNNAVKFGKEASVAMTSKGDSVVIAVTDKGPGVDAEDAERIFERFYKKDSFIPGVGLGLSVARSIAEYLGGTLCLDTNYHGAGARFIFNIPNRR